MVGATQVQRAYRTVRKHPLFLIHRSDVWDIAWIAAWIAVWVVARKGCDVDVWIGKKRGRCKEAVV